MSPLYITLLVITTLLAMGIILMVLLHSPKDKLTWSLSIAFLVCCVLLGFGIVR